MSTHDDDLFEVIGSVSPEHAAEDDHLGLSLERPTPAGAMPTTGTDAGAADDLGIALAPPGSPGGNGPPTTTATNLDEALVTRWLASLPGVQALEKTRDLAWNCGSVVTWHDNGRGHGGGIPTRPAVGPEPDKEALRQAMRCLIERLLPRGYEEAGSVVVRLARAAGVECSRSRSDIRAERGPVVDRMKPLRRMEVR